MHHSSFSSSLALRILSVFTLLALAACGRSPAPTVAESEVVSPLLGVAELGTGFETQSLVSGLQFSEVARELVDVDGTRIQQVTFEVVNDSDQNITNLSLYNVQTDSTVEGTNITNVRDSEGNAVDATTVQAMQATQGRFADGSVNPDKADAYTFTPTDQATTQDLLDTDFPNNSFVVLPKGFIASNTSGQTDRSIDIGETGVVTIAYEYPYTNTPAGTPDSFDLTFAFVNEPTAKTPQSTGPATFQLSVQTLGITTTEGTEVETNIASNVQGAVVTVGQ